MAGTFRHQSPRNNALTCIAVTQWAHNWLVMFTFLQHSDPTVPYYREVRGAVAPFMSCWLIKA